jgi:hypothetical protein
MGLLRRQTRGREPVLIDALSSSLVSVGSFSESVTDLPGHSSKLDLYRESRPVFSDPPTSMLKAMSTDENRAKHISRSAGFESALVILHDSRNAPGHMGVSEE